MFRAPRDREERNLAPDEQGLATRAAWLSYIAGLTHEEIARRLRVSRVKVTRLVAGAQRHGLVRIFVEGRVGECVALETELMQGFGLLHCEVAPDLGEDGSPFLALATAAARHVHREIEASVDGVIGVGHGRTLAALVDRLPRIARPGLSFVSLLGSLTRKSSANPFDVVHRLAEITGGEGYFLPAPFFADSVEDRRVLLAQRGVDHVLELARTARWCMLGIGALSHGSQLVAPGMLTAAEAQLLREAGAVGEILGQFLDAHGQPVDSEVGRRAVALPLDELRRREVVAVAGGPDKVEAILSVLRAGVVTGLITDEITAARLLGRRPSAPHRAVASELAHAR